MITVYDVISRFWLPGLFIIISLLLIFRIIQQNLILGLRSKKLYQTLKPGIMPIRVEAFIY